MIAYRKATANDINPALDLALRIFMEYEAPEYEPEGAINFHTQIEDKKANPDMYLMSKRLMFVALDNDKIVGIIESRDISSIGHIAMLFVDGEYHRKGIATELTNKMVCELKLCGFDKITVNSSPYGLSFYRNFGFTPTETEQKKDGFIFTPMAYEPNEIWDVLDEHGNKTGHYAERGRKMANGDYHLVVHVWKHNGKGEWLIDRRSPNKDGWSGWWETTGGSALAGDDSLTAALRETKEELGLELDPTKGTMFCRISKLGNDGHTWFQDAWVFEHDCLLGDVRFQEGETCDVMWATVDKIRKMMAEGIFPDNEVYPYFDAMVEKWRAAE